MEPFSTVWLILEVLIPWYIWIQGQNNEQWHPENRSRSFRTTRTTCWHRQNSKGRRQSGRKERLMDIVTLINDYGFPVVAVFFLAYFIWYLYNYIVNQIKPKLGSTSTTLITTAAVWATGGVWPRQSAREIFYQECKKYFL